MDPQLPSLRFQTGNWKLSRPYLMGTVNITPDSFYPASRMMEDEVFSEWVGRMAPYMDILDLGAESSRPGADSVSGEEELSLLLPKLCYLKEHFPELRVSIDTYKVETARECIARGADLINDISAGEFSQGRMFELCAQNRVPLVLMHKRGVPKTMQEEVHYRDVVEEVYDYLQSRVDLAEEYGMARDQILIDVGIGFGKKLQHNLDLLRALPKFKAIGTGVLVGASRKSMLGEITGKAVDARMAGSVAVHLAALSRHCHVVRCHDVMEMWDAAKVFFSIIDYDGSLTNRVT